MKALLYCTKGKPYLYREDDDTFMLTNKIQDPEIDEIAEKYYGMNNGTIPCECEYEVENMFELPWEYGYITTSRDDYECIEKECCLSHEDLKHYLGDKLGKAIHIKNLHIFDEPKELDDYKIFDKSYENCFAWAFNEEEKNKPVTKAPQNMMYVFDGNEKKVLISIHPEYLCKILNGEKTIEVRKKVLKCM